MTVLGRFVDTYKGGDMFMKLMKSNKKTKKYFSFTSPENYFWLFFLSSLHVSVLLLVHRNVTLRNYAKCRGLLANTRFSPLSQEHQ
jgi:hypothetical protein